ncbi:MAG: 4-alpha-glucanotransferase [Ferruginibacter sp.]
MHIVFLVKFASVYGQSVFIQFNEPVANGNNELSLDYVNENTWQGNISLNKEQRTKKITAQILIREAGKVDQQGNQLNLKLDKTKSTHILIHCDWYQPSWEQTIYESKAFKSISSVKKEKAIRPLSIKKTTHFFNVNAPVLPEHLSICISGSIEAMGQWLEHPLLMQYSKNGWKARMHIKQQDDAILYKYGIYDSRLKKIITYEAEENRALPMPVEKEQIIFLQENSRLDNAWKLAGINVPVSALKSGKSWGIGDFSDLIPLIDWAGYSGFKLIQLLPINDTTATQTYKDAYPYAAISAFALHPVLLDVHKLAKAANLILPADLLQKVEQINKLPAIDYEAALSCKQQAIELLFEKEQHNFKDDFAWFEFLEINRQWLVPYAAFCYLRDKYKTADYSNWEEYCNYDEEDIQELVSPGSDHYNKIAIHYFIQFHLHLQLEDAVNYAHKNQVALKGDLPIGVHTYSVDTWMNPHLFHMHMQAGAPPDAFTAKGQNWSFPTYNWANMEAEGYSWWRQRMEQLSNYFDAIRIDHVLGFFRIWSIPGDETEGILGRLVPANPVPAESFRQAGINFNKDFFCKPFISEEILQRYFNDDAAWIKINCLDDGKLNHNCETQKKATAFMESYPGKEQHLPALLLLISEVILLKDEELANHYHFRINMQQTEAYRQLPDHEQQALEKLYNDYFYHNQNALWKDEGIKKLKLLAASSNMYICAEDLGMVPDMVPPVLNSMHMTGLIVQRMPQKDTERFADIKHCDYLKVVTPSTHDMSPLRLWWKEDNDATQYFYNHILGHYGTAITEAEPWICKEIIEQHLQSPAVMAVFLLQDLLAMDDNLRRENAAEERINNPANADHNWNYRMHISLETMMADKHFSNNLTKLIIETGR